MICVPMLMLVQNSMLRNHLKKISIQGLCILACAGIILGAAPIEVFAFGCQIQQAGQADSCSPLPGLTQTEAQTQCNTTRCPPGATCTVVDDAQCLAIGGAGGGLPITTSSINALKDADRKIKVVELQNPLSGTDIPTLIGNVVGKAFGLIGTLAVLAFIYGGFQWLTAAGNEEKVTMGVHVMTYATIGIVVIFSSYAVLNTVITGLTKGTYLENAPVGSGGSVDAAAVLGATDCSQLATQGFACRQIDTCAGITNRAASVAEKRTQCDASGGVCRTGVCNGAGQGNDTVCCRAQ